MYLIGNRNYYFLSVFLISLLSLLTALYIEFIVGFKPCSLCLYQRLPYLAAIYISFLGYFYDKQLLWVYLSLAIFILSSIISGFHVGVENGIFEELKNCKNNLGILNKEDLLNSLKNQNISCKDVPLRFLGLSLATLNLILSLTISVLTIIHIKYAKNR